jgi:hypothetical protein
MRDQPGFFDIDDRLKRRIGRRRELPVTLLHGSHDAFNGLGLGRSSAPPPARHDKREAPLANRDGGEHTRQAMANVRV